MVQVVSTLKGATNHLVMQSAHFDNLVIGANPQADRMPGANDDGSGIAVGLACARRLAGSKPRNTYRFVAYCGEEQGLLGAKALAERAVQGKWSVDAILNHDMVGNSADNLGRKVTDRVRMFSDEGSPRELARHLEWLVRQLGGGFGIDLVLRKDRMGRGGDHTPFAEAGFPAVRWIEKVEEWERQHTLLDTVDHVDFEYLARVADATLLCLKALGEAKRPPTKVELNSHRYHTELTWKTTTDTSYVVYWRETSSAKWQHHRMVGTASSVVLEGVNPDDHFFAVGSVGGVPVPVT